MHDEAQRTGLDAQDVDKVTAQMADEQRDAKEAHKLEPKLKELARDNATQLRKLLACFMLPTKIHAQALMIGEFNQICSVIGSRRDSHVKDMMLWL